MSRWHRLCTSALLLLAANLRAEVSVEPASGEVLSSDLQYLTLNFDPPIDDAELAMLGAHYELRDMQHGLLYASPMPVGFEEPYDQVLLIFQDNYEWTPGGQIHLEIIPPDLDPPGTITRLHAEWTYACDGCGWMAESEGYNLSLFGVNDEILDMLPTDLDRDGDLDLALIARERIIWLGLDPLYDGVVSQSLGVRNLDRPLQTREARNASYSGRAGQEILLYSTGQDEHVTIFRRSGSGDTLWFEPEQISGESFAMSPMLMLPVGTSGGHLCNDLLVATRGGSLMLYPSYDDCSGIDMSSGVELLDDLGTPLSIVEFPGRRFNGTTYQDIIAVLDDAYNQLHIYGYDGESLDELLEWRHSGHVYQSLLAWNNYGDSAIDLMLYNSDGEFCLLEDLDGDTPEPGSWRLDHNVYHAQCGQRGELLLATDGGVLSIPDPSQSSDSHTLIASESMGGSAVRHLRLCDANLDGDQDLVVLMDDGSVHLVCNEVIGTRQLAYTDSLAMQHLLPGETSTVTLYVRNEGAEAPIELTIDAAPADSPVQWDAYSDSSFEPDEVASLEISYTADAELDTIYTDLLTMDWTVTGSGRINHTSVVLLVSGGETGLVWSTDHVAFDPVCEVWPEGACEPDCPTATVRLSCPATVKGRLELLGITATSENAAAGFCTTAATTILYPGQSLDLPLYFCPFDNSQRPLQVNGSLIVEIVNPTGDTSFGLPLTGVIQCEDPWFAGELPDLLEDVPQVIDFSSLIGDDDDPASALILTIEDVVGTNGEAAGDVLVYSEVENLRVQLSPALNANSELYPDLALALRLGDAAGNFTRDTLAVFIQAVDDVPVLQESPPEEFVEGRTAQLAFTVFDPDAHGLNCSAIVRTGDDSEGTAIAFSGLSTASTLIEWDVEPGDSLRFGSLEWSLTAMGSLPFDASGSCILRTAEADLALELQNSLPQSLTFGDTLELDLAIDLVQGPWNGMLAVTVSQNGTQVFYRNLGQVLLVSGSLDLDPVYLVMPLSQGSVEWQAELLVSGGREELTGNLISGTVAVRAFEYAVRPRIFTPNGDGTNDLGVFDFGSVAARDQHRVELYDLSGQRLIRATLPAGTFVWSWDGRVNGHPVLPGVYPYIMYDGNQVLARGTVGVAR